MVINVPASPSHGRAVVSLRMRVINPEELCSDDAGVRFFRALILLAAAEAVAGLVIFAIVRAL